MMFIATGKEACIAVPSARPWIMPLAALGLLSILWGLLYRDAVASAVAVWWISPTYSHCFLILPIALYLVWLRRHELACLEPAPWLPALLLAIPMGIGWVLGRLSSTNEVQQLSAVGLFQMILLGMLGPKAYRVVLFPALLLFFLVPVGQYLIPLLQRLTTLFVSSGLSVLNIVHYTEGNVIELENSRFLVAEACAGLRFLIANVVLCIVFAHFVFRRPAKIALFLLFAVLVPVLANGLRALGIVLIAHWTDNRLAVGADHLIYGWGFSILILLLLFGIALRFRDEAPQQPLIRWREAPVPAGRQGILVAVLAAVFLALPVALVQAQAVSFPAREPVMALSLPQGWRQTSAIPDWSPSLPGARHQRRLALKSPGGGEVDFSYGYYDSGGHPAALPETQFWEEGKFNLIQSGERPEKVATVREIVLSNPRDRRILWWTYWKDGVLTTSAAAVKLLAVRNAFRPHGGVGVILISTKSSGDDDEARARLESALWTFRALSMPDESRR